MALLILGGTADARRITTALVERKVSVIYSVAGLVRLPNVDCEIVSGGFKALGGLDSFLAERKISAILNATHPYAQKMSRTAVKSANTSGIPCWRFHRPAWQPGKGDHWLQLSDWRSLIPHLTNKQHLFFTVGQIPLPIYDEVCVVTRGRGRQHLLRTAVAPKMKLPVNMRWQKAIGPFHLAEEMALMSQYQIDALVTKNSGGDSTRAKLDAARQLNIPVLMLQRPEMIPADKIFEKIETCAQWVAMQFVT